MVLRQLISLSFCVFLFFFSLLLPEEIEDRGHTLDIIDNSVYNGTFLASKHVLTLERQGIDRGCIIIFVIAACEEDEIIITPDELLALSNTQGCELTTSVECVAITLQEITSPVDIIIDNAC